MSNLENLISAVDNHGLSYLGPEALKDLSLAVLAVEKMRIPGSIIETGCALGGSAIVIAASKAKSRPLLVYDVFGLIPPPSDKDGADVHERYAEIASGRSAGLRGKPYYGYARELLGQVKDNFSANGFDTESNNISLIQGLYRDTLTVDAPVALAHIDCDWYESVRLCLERIAPRVSPGGVMVIDDYYHYSGCKAATDEFLNTGAGKLFRKRKKSRLHLYRYMTDPSVN
jgi:asparagine synthase (glutamine-hydrolysing)